MEYERGVVTWSNNNHSWLVFCYHAATNDSWEFYSLSQLHVNIQMHAYEYIPMMQYVSHTGSPRIHSEKVDTGR